MKALILAAGIGSRLNLDIPKPMFKIDGKPILEHNILLLKKHGITDIYINIHYKPEIIKNYLGDGSKFGVKIQYSYEEKLLGTSGAVKNIESFWGNEPFFILYGDNYTNINLTDMLSTHLTNKPITTIAVFDSKKVISSGIAGGIITLDQNNKLLSFIEGKGENNSGYVNAGVYILESQILDIIPKNVFSDFGNDIFPELLIKGHLIKGYLIKEGFVIAIDTKDAFEIANRLKGNLK